MLRPFAASAFLAIGASWLGNAALVATPLIVKGLVDHAIVARDQPLLRWTMLLVVVGLLRGVLTFGRRWFGGRLSIDAEADLRKRIHNHLQSLDVVTHDGLSQGQIVSRANADVGLISQLLAFVPFLSGNVLQLVASFVVMAFLSPTLLGILLLIVPPMAFIGSKLRRWVYPSNIDAQNRQSDLAAVADEAIVGVRVVKGFGQEDQELRRFEATARELYGARMRNVRITAKYSPALGVIPSFGVALLLAVGGRLVKDRTLSVGTFLAFATYLGQLVAPIRTSSLIVSIVQSARAGATRVFEIFDLASRITSPPNPVPLTEPHPVLEFHNVSVAYGEGPVVLHNISTRINPGETVAIVGGSGSGKTTFALAAARFLVPMQGSITLSGVDIATAELEAVRHRVGMVFDEALLFSDSVARNIAFGNAHASEDDIEAAAIAAQAEGFIRALPKGFDTVVGEQGLTLSGGQRQRVALARAFLANAPILILDDATSALDTRTEAAVFEALVTAKASGTASVAPNGAGEHSSLDLQLPSTPRTTILIANRPSTVALATRILVLVAGRIIDDGSHDELVARCALYRELLVNADATEAAVANAIALGVMTADVPRAAALAKLAPSMESGPAQGVMRVGSPVLGSSSPPPGTSMGPPGGFRGGAMTMGPMGFPALPATLARIALLPPITDEVPVTAAASIENAQQPLSGFKLTTALRWHKQLIRAGFALVLLDTLLALTGPALISYGIDSGVTKGSLRALNIAVGLYMLTSAIDLVVVRASGIVVGRAGERILYDVRMRVFAKLQSLGLDFYEREMTGRILTRVTNDVDSLANFVQTGVVSLLTNVLTLFGVGAYLMVRNSKLGLVALSSFPLLIAATAWFRVASSRAYEAVRNQVAAVNARFAESFAGSRIVQSFGQEHANAEEFAAIVVKHRAARLRAQRAASLYFPVAEALGVLSTAAVLWFGAASVHNGSLTSGALLAFVLYLTQLFSPIQQLTVVLDAWQSADAATAKIRTLLEEPISTPNPPATLILTAQRNRALSRDANPDVNPDVSPHVSTDTSPEVIEAANPGARVELKGVRFAYQTGEIEGLRGIDLTLAAGETVALVGTTGAGKSTVLKLIPRFYDPTVGVITVDGIDLRHVDLTGWRHQLGFVPQEPVLFSGTIAQNIAYGRRSSTPEQIEAAAVQVGADAVVGGMPDGYQTVISARGRSLSAGQRQLIALARAALVNPRLLLLDEATSNLDLASEARVQAAMGVLAKSRTTLLIAHRLDTARRANRIVVMEHGEIVEDGPHDDLVAANGTYSRLWARAQG
jgi:ATP-binding cassette, subfamily B, bacterial